MTGEMHRATKLGIFYTAVFVVCVSIMALVMFPGCSMSEEQIGQIARVGAITAVESMPPAEPGEFDWQTLILAVLGVAGAGGVANMADRRRFHKRNGTR